MAKNYERISRSVTNRSRGIGGSDVGALFGLNKWLSLPRLWLQKCGRLPKQGAQSVNELMEWGSILEAPIARQYGEKSGRRLQAVNDTLVHSKFPWMIGNPDRLQWDSGRPRAERCGILEVKATMFGNLRLWQAGGVPSSYYLQLQHYLAITGLTWGSFAVLFGGNRLVQFDVARDEKLIEVLIAREREFWQLVTTETPPSMALSKEWNRELAAFFPEAVKGKTVVTSAPAAVGAARRLLALRRQIAKREAEAETLEAALKILIGEAGGDTLVIPTVARATWSTGQRSHVDLDTLRAKYPEIAKALTSSTASRRFTLRDLREKPEADSEELEDELTGEGAAMYGARMLELD